MAQPIPQPKGVPLLGNIFDIKPSNTWTSLKALAEEHGEIFQVKILGKTIVFVASAALAEEVCDEKRFRKFVGGPIVEIRAAVHDSLFTAYASEEAVWGVAHRILAPHMSPDAIARWCHPEMRDAAQELLDLWTKRCDGGLVMEPFEQLARLELETMTRALYGQRLGALTGPRHPMLRAMEEATSEAVMRPARPALVNALLYGRKFRAAVAVLREWAEGVVRHRRENPTDREDMLASMLAAKDPQTGRGLSESQVIDEVVTMPVGSSTSPCLLAMALYLLLGNQGAVRRAREEIAAVVGDDRGAPIEYAHVGKLTYVGAIVHEALRLSFAAPGFNIEPVPSADGAPVSLAGGKYEVAHDQAIILVMAGINRDPAVFEDPEAFRPERMLPEEFARLPPGVKKWFGNGRRACFGTAYAWHSNVLVLAMLLRAVDFEAADEGYVLERDGWFNYRPVGFKVKVKPRAD
ncbi:Cytochrome P450 [Cordyceps fumosorosea ARSEF 2679]|uniref:Cytochrome P450 n=1 Tax=Cordyceps fumosorosea (strain ARSEF 2679) TaxID=1081104 RepID=A0A168ASR2_CORFA|nr:Cytochrome P450 [Cordyceps fumosorosea ARSEF 2679]OAA69143.1 Cytochrome P450 [Cordyceps fumosorosea ARSEF 2679]